VIRVKGLDEFRAKLAGINVEEFRAALAEAVECIETNYYPDPDALARWRALSGEDEPPNP
jgi:hypothetical protein